MPAPLIALAGNPNSGKTTIFNALTGLNYKVANYPGVTVERKESSIRLPGGSIANLVDLPGIYTLSGLSIDERIATTELVGSRAPDLVVHVCDSTNLERNFFLLSQLLDCGHNVILALTMVDLARKSGLRIHKELLSRALGIPVVEIYARERQGLAELLSSIESELTHEAAPVRFAWVANAPEFSRIAGEVGARAQQDLPEFASTHPILIGAQLIAESWPAESPALREQVAKAKAELQELGYDPQSFETTERYRWIGETVRRTTAPSQSAEISTARKLDRVLTHKVWGTLIFLVLMAALFQSIFVLAQYPMHLLEQFVGAAGGALRGVMPAGQLRSLLENGVVAGVGSVIIFVPQIAILFCLLALLEDTGYLSRAAFLMDRVLRPFGLQGRSFVPLLSSFACAIPGILSTRTIPARGDRLATILVAPLMACSARLPIYAVLIGAFVPETSALGIFSLQGLVLLALYLFGVVGAVLVSAVLRRTILRGHPALFVMEMPPYRLPIMRNVLRQVFDAVRSFLSSAGTVILAITIILWFLASYPRNGIAGGEQVPVEQSYAGQLGQFIEPAIKPLGFNWEIGVSVIASFAAREVFVSSLSTVYNLQEEDDVVQPLTASLRERHAKGIFTGATAASLLVFYVFACMCMSTLAVTRRETGSWGWAIFMFVYQTALAYVLAFAIYESWRMLFP